VRAAIKYSIFFSRPPKAKFALGPANRIHILKNTISVRACKKKMHENEKIFGLQQYLRTAANSISPLPACLRHRPAPAPGLWSHAGFENSRRGVLDFAYSHFIFSSLGGLLHMMLRTRLCLSVLALSGSITLAQQTPAPRPLAVDDLFGMREVHDPQISPDSQFIAYTVTSTSLKEDKSLTRIWMVPAAGGEPIPLTIEEVSSAHPRWSPDSKLLAFLSERKDAEGNEGKTQVYLLNLLGGEAQRLTDTIQDVEDFAWFPDGKRLVLVLRDPSPEEIEEAAAKGKEEEAAEKSTPRKKHKAQRPWVIDRLIFKEDTVGYLERRRTHLYVFDLASKSITQVSSGDYDDSNPAWSPDGKLLAFSSNRSQPDPDFTYASNIWVVPADSTDKGAHPLQVTHGLGGDHQPAWSPDGKSIAYSTQLDPKLFDYGTRHIAVVPSTGGEPKVLTQTLDRNSNDPRFARDGKSIYFVVDDDGTQNLAQANLSDGKITRPIGGRLMLDGFSVSKDGTLAASVSTMDRPYELYSVLNGQPTRLTHVNDAWLAQFKLSPGEYVSFKSKDGTTVHGYLYKPLDYVPGKKYPTILRPHGGPVWAYYAEFEGLEQLFAANGYVVLLPNPRGSSGYGQDFCKAIFADWGNKDYQDDMAIVDQAVAQGIADPDKLGVGGWSYGGISTDFIIGQTNRFKAAISGAGAAEFTSLWGHDQYVRDYIAELGLPWEHRDTWDHVAQFWHMKDIHTPAMFVGGSIDWNVPVLGGEQMYESLRALGRETLLVVYPDEYHGFKAPSHIRDLHERYLAWYAHYVKADGTPARPPEKPSKPAN
jgi:dipeptidyl aminopeptidase/acylaminoacyl peptidase